MSGLIEPYFYPKKRDGIFQRTLFIAPETAAVVSNSIGDQISVAANILHRDRTIISSYTEEFLQYLSLCRPLMQIFTAKNHNAFYDNLLEFEEIKTDTLIKTESFSSLTMPEALMASIIERSGIDPDRHFPIHTMRHSRFLENLQHNHFTELIHLPDIQTLRDGKVKIAMSTMLNTGVVSYTIEEYIIHLKQIIALLESYKNYHIILTDGSQNDQYTIYAREELGVLVAKTSQPAIVLFMKESNLSAAFWDFLKNIVNKKAYTDSDNKSAIAHLSNYLKKLTNEV
ncbi:MAG: hypothetical protein ACOX05_04060 [Bacillota bacterium]|jgi:hypothetical protein